MSRTLTVEGDLTTADTRHLLTTQGSITAPSLVVPAGMTKIDKIIMSVAGDSAADASTSYVLRLNGGAVKDGEQTIAMGATGFIDVQTGADSNPQVGRINVMEDVDIAINASDVITIAADVATGDPGTAHAVVTLVFA